MIFRKALMRNTKRPKVVFVFRPTPSPLSMLMAPKPHACHDVGIARAARNRTARFPTADVAYYRYWLPKSG